MDDVILTVTMSPAYDTTYRVERLERGGAHRVSSVEQRIGGKGVNVTRVLNQLGRYAKATGFADHAFAAAAELELPNDFVLALPWVRRTLMIGESADGTATEFAEPGARVSNPHAADQLSVRIRGLLPGSTGLVIAGTLPIGIEDTLPAELAAAAIEAGVPTVCDLSGEALRLAARVPGVVLCGSFSDLTGGSGDLDALLPATERLIAGGAAGVVAVRGPADLVARTPDGCWWARLPDPPAGNPTGAGDAATAAIIAALSHTPSPGWPTLLTDAVATSAAAVVVPAAGEIDRALRERVLSEVVVTEAEPSPLP
ncbi:PfkB family carbohydrate kinase [Nocardia asteroides]|uniref:PfkB family carbohydrate kinase n=1 Tax=Nocardia asteroides TaxID=1824 RepID=UPI001E420A68|nr:PfkB family carbohydrate kinase [Nocardia asteroides]UGT64712.1 PfkB family carbohydrate kinase [Nocardia asteroides]